LEINLQAREINKVVIAGGGTAGWLAAAALSQQLGRVLDITLIESDEIGTIGVGEATIPPIRVFHKLLQIDEQEFMRATAATFKLGISFENWARKGDRYVHSFGRNGKPTWMCEFHNFWLRSRELGVDSELGEYCFELQAAKAGKFATSPQLEINYAYHFDAGQYARFLRRFAEGFGIKRVEGKIKEVKQNGESGFIDALVLHSGQIIEGDLFIDCTGFRGLLIEQTLKSGYEDWSQWLPCDSAAAVQTELTAPAQPLTRSIAHDAGWRWCIPLQHRVGNGLVFSSRHVDDDAASEELIRSIDGKPLTAPRVLKFQTGRRRTVWNKNCVALGLASGFIEPLESTSIHMMMVGVTRLMHLFPFAGITQSLVDQYNEGARLEMEKTRDFIVLHYHATQRDDSEFWRHCRDMPVPDSLTHRIELFKESAYAFQGADELFRVDSWTQVMLGQRIIPKSYHYAARLLSEQELTKFLAEYRASITQTVSRMPVHQDFVNQYCRSSNNVWN
jgi:tryptophan halogenase